MRRPGQLLISVALSPLLMASLAIGPAAATATPKSEKYAAEFEEWLKANEDNVVSDTCAASDRPAVYDKRSVLIDESELDQALRAAPSSVVQRLGKSSTFEVVPSKAALDAFEGDAGAMFDTKAKGLRTVEKNWLMFPAPHRFWAVSPPIPTSLPTPPASDPAVGAGTTIAVIDSGQPLNGQAGMPAGVTLMTSGYVGTPAPSQVPGHLVGVSDVAKRISSGAAVHAYDLTLDTGVLTEAAVIDWLYAYDYPVINLSAGMYPCTFPTALYDAVLFATQAGGQPKSVLLAAAGNDATAAPSYPAAFGTDPVLSATVVGVGSATGGFFQAAPQTTLSSFTNIGPNMTSRAPGESIVVNYPDGSGGLMNALVSGTSFASPYGAGVAACLIGHGMAMASVAPSMAAKPTLGLPAALGASSPCLRP
jgi:Subtilase family